MALGFLSYGSMPLQHFISITDSNTEPLPRGTKYGKPLVYLCYNKYNTTAEIFFQNKKYTKFDISSLIPLTVISTEIPLASYSATVKFAAKKDEFAAEVWRNNVSEYKSTVISGAGNVMHWLPADIDENGYQGQNKDYGWWED